MLILPKEELQKRLESHNQAKEGLIKCFNEQLEKILNQNSNKDEYYILGKVKFPKELGGKVGRTFLEASDVKPPLVKESFVYHVDNKRGVKTLLWVMNPNGSLRFPTLNKTISVAG